MSNGDILGLVSPVIALIFSITFFMLWTQDKTAKHLFGFSYAFLMCSIGVTVSHFIISEFSYLNVLMSGLLYSAGIAAFFWAHCTRMKSASPHRITAWIGLTGSLLACLVVAGTSDIALRFYGVMMTTAAQFTIGAWWIKTRVPCTAENNGLFGTCIVIILLMSVSPIIVYQIEGPIAPGKFQDSLQWAMTNAYVSVCVIFLAIYLIFGHSKDLLERLTQASQIDFLTGLKNRQAYDHGFQEMLHAQETTDLQISVIIADIDNFKSINDHYGHLVGDEVIKAFGTLFRELAGEHDVAGRVGGEEISLVLWNSNTSSALLAARSLCSRFSQLQIAGLPDGMTVTASFGVATTQSNAESKSSLYARADMALYRAKNTGKNKVCLAGPNSPDKQETPTGKVIYI